MTCNKVCENDGFGTKCIPLRKFFYDGEAKGFLTLDSVYSINFIYAERLGLI